MEKEDHEAEIIGRYLLGVSPSAAHCRLYRQGIISQNISIPVNEKKYWDLAIMHPLFLPYIDAGLALKNPSSAIRRRVHLMFAILETEPTLADRFIYRGTPYVWYPQVAFFGIRAIFRSLLGFILISLA